MSRKCGNFDASQRCGPPQPVTGIALPFSLPSFVFTSAIVSDLLRLHFVASSSLQYLATLSIAFCRPLLVTDDTAKNCKKKKQAWNRHFSYRWCVLCIIMYSTCIISCIKMLQRWQLRSSPNPHVWRTKFITSLSSNFTQFRISVHCLDTIYRVSLTLNILILNHKCSLTTHSNPFSKSMSHKYNRSFISLSKIFVNKCFHYEKAFPWFISPLPNSIWNS
jgi:hypothetical protein